MEENIGWQKFKRTYNVTKTYLKKIKDDKTLKEGYKKLQKLNRRKYGKTYEMKNVTENETQSIKN